MKITTKQLETERLLNRRLRIIGYLLLVFAACAVAWDFLPFVESELDELLRELEEAPPPLNCYLVAAIFASIGAVCLLVYWKKKTLLSSQLPP